MQQGELRRLGVAFTRFVAQLGTADPVLLLSCVVLSELEGRGHSCLRIPDLLNDPDALLGWPAGQWQALQNSAGPLPATSRLWLRQLAACSQVLLEAELDHGQPLLLVDDRLYLRRYWNYECAVASAVQRKASQPRPLDLQQVRQGLDLLFGVAKNTDAAQTVDWQRIACAIAVRSHFSIITGGPGTGKTYTVARLLALLFSLSAQAEQLRIVLAAPTGKAAARLKQAIDHALSGLAEKMQGQLPLTELAARMAPAATLHSLLGARPDTRSFRHHAGNPLDVDVLIVDEASMVHLEMMAAILDALPPHAMLILLGDKDQLASVEAGAVLGDLCQNASAGAYLPETAAYVQAASGQQLPAAMLHGQSTLAQQTVMLRESRRFGGPIGQLALAVNAGEVAASSHLLQTDNSGMLSWYAQAQLPALLQLALAGRAGVEDSYLPYLQLLQAAPVLQPGAADGGADGGNEEGYLAWVKQVLLAFDRFRILCAVREGEWGVAGVNALIEQALIAQRWIQKRSDWYAGRPVMITRNDYGLGVFNGDIGMTLPDPRRPDSLRVYFLQGEQVRSVLATRLADVETAFAMTVHKSQGSEFSHVALVLPGQGGSLLARELLYTGITRARQFFTLLTPQPGVFGDALQRQTKRVSGLSALLS
ncbi:exodeoxyribonuclease V subunit alpha [Undibacterium sp. B2R-29]|nr:exodeoxyribonuclease V subunit alpha [Undibacterium crateris]